MSNDIIISVNTITKISRVWDRMITHIHNDDSLLLTQLEAIFDINTVYTILANQNVSLMNNAQKLQSYTARAILTSVCRLGDFSLIKLFQQLTVVRQWTTGIHTYARIRFYLEYFLKSPQAFINEFPSNERLTTEGFVTLLISST